MANLATLDSLNKKKKDDGESESNEYYAGGVSGQGGGSGLSVMGPGGDREGDMFSKILTRAANENGAGQAAQGQEEERMVDVTFYSNGFTINDGPLRELGVRENERFLKQVMQGLCPEELIVDGKPASVHLIDKRQEEYKPPAYVAFSGGGQTAGVPATDSSATITPNAGAAQPTLNESEPAVRIQLVFPDRKRLVVKLNKSHTVRHIIAIVDGSGNISSPYQLLAASNGPPKPITEFDATIETANLGGATVTVKTI